MYCHLWKFQFQLLHTFQHFSDLQTVWSWYANRTPYFGHLRYMHSVGIEGCLVVAYLWRSI